MPVPQGVQISLNDICLAVRSLPRFDMGDLLMLAGDAAQPVLAQVASVLQLRVGGAEVTAFYEDCPYICLARWSR